MCVWGGGGGGCSSMSANSLAGKGLKTLFKSVSFTLLGRRLFVLFWF